MMYEVLRWWIQFKGFFWFCIIQTQTNAIWICIFVGKLSYSRDFLISLANCAESRKKPEFLPEYSIVLTKAVSLKSAFSKRNDCATVEWCHQLSGQRDAEHLKLHEMWWNEGKGEMWVSCFEFPWLYVTCICFANNIPFFRMAESPQLSWVNLQKCFLHQRTVPISLFVFLFGGFNLVVFICMFIIFDNNLEVKLHKFVILISLFALFSSVLISFLLCFYAVCCFI